MNVEEEIAVEDQVVVLLISLSELFNTTQNLLSDTIFHNRRSRNKLKLVLCAMRSLYESFTKRFKDRQQPPPFLLHPLDSLTVE